MSKTLGSDPLFAISYLYNDVFLEEKVMTMIILKVATILRKQFMHPDYHKV